MQKAVNFFKEHKTGISLFLILFFALFLRLNQIERMDGLWLDEAYSYYVASQSFPFGIISKLYHEDFHAPLYFFILHFWMKIFGTNDIVLRILSVIISLLSVIAVYFLGKETGATKTGVITCGRKTGVVAAVLLAVSAFSVFYSQEVRFYILASIFAATSVTFLLKYFNSPERRWLAGLVISNLLLMFTLTFGVVFVAVEIFVAFIYLIKSKRELKNFALAQLITGLLYAPYLPVIYHQNLMTNLAITRPFDWYIFSFKNVWQTFIMWFTPLCTNNFLGLVNYYNVVEFFIKKKAFLQLFFVVFVPYIILIWTIVKTVLSKNIKAQIVLSIFGLYTFCQIFLAFLGKIPFIERYTLVGLPLIIVLGAYWLCSFKNKVLQWIFALLLFLTPLYFMLKSEFSPNLMSRINGFNNIQRVFSQFNIGKNDVMLMPYGGKQFYKYNPIKVIDVNDIELFYIYNPDKLPNIFPYEVAKKINKSNIDFYAREYIKNLSPNPANKKMYELATKNLEKGRHFIISSIKDPANTALSEENFKLASENDLFLKLCPKMGLIMNKVEYDYFKLLSNDSRFEYIGKAINGDWKIVIFRKVK